jgi:hypothetical protein
METFSSRCWSTTTRIPFIRAIQPMRAAYNGGLLDPDLADELALDAEVFRRVLKSLYAPWSPYRFDVLGVEILGSIYERALGSEVRLSEARGVTIELKPEVRKAGGVYYTPQWASTRSSGSRSTRSSRARLRKLFATFECSTRRAAPGRSCSAPTPG